jgi:hypothetical protein
MPRSRAIGSATSDRSSCHWDRNVTALVLGIALARDIQQAVLRPLFLTLVMLRFHGAIRGQAIDLTWDARLDQVSTKFQELKARAEGAAPIAARPAGALA